MDKRPLCILCCYLFCHSEPVDYAGGVTEPTEGIETFAFSVHALIHIDDAAATLAHAFQQRVRIHHALTHYGALCALSTAGIYQHAATLADHAHG